MLVKFSSGAFPLSGLLCRHHQFAADANPMADREEPFRIQRLAADSDLVMQVRSVNPSGTAHLADDGPVTTSAPRRTVIFARWA